MTTDALRAVLKKMPVPKRLELAAMDEEMHQLATCFHDIDSLFLEDEAIILGGKEPVSRLPAVPAKSTSHHHLEKILHYCPAVLRLFVQAKLSREEWQLLAEKKANTLQKLYISNENFVDGAPGNGVVEFKRLKSLGILQRQNQQLRLNLRIDADHLKPVLSASLHRVCLTGVVLQPSALQAIFSLPDLRSLDLIGVLVDSKQAAAIIPTLKSPPRLQEVSLPPSLFAFTKLSTVKFDFRWLKVPKLCLYMEYFHEETFKQETDKMLPKDLKTLVLYGNTNRLQQSPKLHKYKYAILFGPIDAGTMTPKFAEKSSQLVGHLVRRSPYTRTERIANRQENWQFDLSTAVDDMPTRSGQQQMPGGILQMLLNGIPVRRPAGPRLPALAPLAVPAPLAPPPPPPLAVGNAPAVALPAVVPAPPPAPAPQPAAAGQAPAPNVEAQVIDALIDALLNDPEL